MADLDMQLAESLAESLTTVGHPRSKAAILATAGDLWRLCKGTILEGRPWTADEQAGWVVAEARMWTDGWPERGGTAALYSLFRAKFSPRRENRPFDADATPEQKAAWRAQYGEPQPAFAKTLLSTFDQKKAHEAGLKGSRWQAIRDSIYYAEGPGRHELANVKDRGERNHSINFWQEALKKHDRKHAAEVAAFRAELEQHGWEALMAFEWAKGVAS